MSGRATDVDRLKGFTQRELGRQAGRPAAIARVRPHADLAEPEAVAAIPIDHFDGLDTFDDLPRDPIYGISVMPPWTPEFWAEQARALISK